MSTPKKEGEQEYPSGQHPGGFREIARQSMGKLKDHFDLIVRTTVGHRKKIVRADVVEAIEVYFQDKDRSPDEAMLSDVQQESIDNLLQWVARQGKGGRMSEQRESFQGEGSTPYWIKGHISVINTDTATMHEFDSELKPLLGDVAEINFDEVKNMPKLQQFETVIALLEHITKLTRDEMEQEKLRLG